MTIKTLADKQAALSYLVEEYCHLLHDQQVCKEAMARNATEAELIPGVRKRAYIAICKAIAEQDGDIEDRIKNAEPQLENMLLMGVELPEMEPCQPT
jgi:hypothetical protein